MSEVREYVTQALALRAKNRIKVRQPLALLSIPSLGKFIDYPSVITEEVNVKQVELGSVLELDTHLTPSLRQEGIMREIIRHVQSGRKKAGLQVDDRISLSLSTDAINLKDAISNHGRTIAAEVLADKVESGKKYTYQETVNVEGEGLTLSLEKVG